MCPSQTLFYHFYAGLDMKRLEKIDFGVSMGERLDEVRLLVVIFGGLGSSRDWGCSGGRSGDDYLFFVTIKRVGGRDWPLYTPSFILAPQ
jgi:hypothetical protein